MENMNKIISFVLGLIVIVILVAVLTNRFDIRGRVQRMISGESTQVAQNDTNKEDEEDNKNTPTPTKAGGKTNTPTPTKKVVASSNTNDQDTETVTEIPKTGNPTLMLPILLGILGSGMLLTNSGKK